MQIQARVLGVALLGVISACAVDDDEPGLESDFEFETRRVVIRGYGHSPEEVCGGTAQWIDDYVDALAPYYDLPEGKIGDYGWYTQAVWDEFGFCGTALACTATDLKPHAVFARTLPLEHELVHLMQGRASNNCIFMLEEGLADYLRGTDPVPIATTADGSFDHMLDVTFGDAKRSTTDYPHARHFVSMLVADHGLESVLDLCDTTPMGTSREQFDVAANELFGRDLQGLLEDYAFYPDCTNAQDRARIFECGRAPKVEIGRGDEVSVELEAACASEAAIGPRAGETFALPFQIRILEDGDYTWRLELPVDSNADLEEATLRLEQCAACVDGPIIHEVSWSADWIALPEPLVAGDYLVEIELPLEFSDVIFARFNGLL